MLLALLYTFTSFFGFILPHYLIFFEINNRFEIKYGIIITIDLSRYYFLRQIKAEIERRQV